MKHRLPFWLFSTLLFIGNYTALTQIPSVDAFMNQKITKKKIAGAVVLISQNDSIVHYKPYGYQDIRDNIQMDTNSIFRIYSMTKPITSVGVLLLIDQGKLKLDDPIHKYLPELKELRVLNRNKRVAQKNAITVRDLLRHTAGFTYGFFSNTKVDKLYKKAHPLFVENGEQFINRLSQLPLLNQPGEKHHYSVATDVLGILIERVSGESLSIFLKNNLFIPLDMMDTHFKLPKNKLMRFTSSYTPSLKEKEYYKETPYLKKRFESGGGGLVSTASDYLKFCNMLSNNGRHKNKQIISYPLVKAMRSNQLKTGDGAYKGVSGIGFGLGVSVQTKEWGNWGHVGDYGWSGAASTHFFISPKENVTVIILSQIQPFTNQLQKGLKPIILQHVAK